jgi:hypothetical protein
MELRVGELLVENGVLDVSQVDEVLAEQKRTGEPFGKICERMFDIDPAAVEAAWAFQYARITRRVDPRTEYFEPRALALVTRRQAWQFRVLPIRFDGAELMIATTQQHLPRALRFASNVVGIPVYLVVAESDALGAALCRHYPLPGMTPAAVDDGALDRLLEAGDGQETRARA